MKSPEEEEVRESLRLVPYVYSWEDGGSSSHKGFAVDHWSCIPRTKFIVLLLKLGYTRSSEQVGTRSSPMTSCIFLLCASAPTNVHLRVVMMLIVMRDRLSSIL